MKKLTAILLVTLMLASTMPSSALAAELPKTEVVASSVETQQVGSATAAGTTAQETENNETEPEQAEPSNGASTVVQTKEKEESIGDKIESEPLVASSFTYTVSNNQVTITGLIDNTITDLVIPDTIEEMPVKAINGNAFNGCSQITSITVPNSVTSIGDGAFKGTNPTRVTLPFIGNQRGQTSSYSSVFGYIFGSTYSSSESTTTQDYDIRGTYYYYIPKTIEEVVVTDETVIPYGAFFNCSWIEKIEINDNVTEIGINSFYNCSSLLNFTIPNSITEISYRAFYNCKALKNIVVPDTLKKYGESSFMGCSSLENIPLPNELTSIGGSAFSGCSALVNSDLVIPNKVTTIGSNAFSGCSNITNITVPNNVTSIGNGAFGGTNPTRVTLPFIGNTRTASGITNGVFGYVFGYTADENRNIDGATTQGTDYYTYYGTIYYNFYIPKSIIEVIITDATQISENAFYNCNWIEKVYINDIEGDVSKVGSNAFYNCPAMTVYINRETAVHTYCERNGIKHCSTKSISLDSDSLVLFRNGTDTIGSEVILLNDKVDDAPETVWTSSNPEVATVDRNTGVISAVAPGTATITADSEGVTATAEVTVYFKLDGISLNKDETQIDIGKSETLTVIYNPDNTTDSKDVTWKSSNNAVATVDENGKVKAVKRGKATITATGANGVTATCEVQVLVPITEIKFESDTASIPRSTRQKVPFTISPADYTDTYTVTSSDTEIATVDKFGNVVARKVGTAVITVTSSRGLEASCVVTVYSPATSIKLSAESETIFANRSLNLTAELSPSDCTDNVKWTSSDDTIAEVDSNGKVTGISKGVATITATSDSGITAECIVTVESDINNTTIYLEYNEIDYNGEDKTPEVYVYFDDEQLVEETDYILYYYDNLEAGTAGVIITSLYDGTEITKNFKINPLTVTALDIICKPTMTYTGSALKGVENITYKSLSLVEGVDYDINYENNVNVGKATVTITGKGNFAGPTTRTFSIVPKPISQTTITLDNNTFRYDGKRKTPTVTVRDGAKTLELGKDYNVEYSDNINAGEATVTVTGIGNFGSYAEKKFNIEKRSISDATVVLSEDKFLDNGDGRAYCPQVTVTDGDRELEQDVDYIVSYDNNIEAGIGTVVITAMGNYTSSTSANFEICLTGDINKDGRVDILDATAVQKFSVEKINFTDYQKFVADVNHDGVVDILDASSIQKFAVEKIEHF